MRGRRGVPKGRFGPEMPQILLKIEGEDQAFGVFFVFSVMGPNLRGARVQKGVPLRPRSPLSSIFRLFTMSRPTTAAEIRAATAARSKAEKAVFSARMAALASATKVTVAAAGVAATLKSPDASLALVRSAHASLGGSLTAYKTAAAKAVATSRLLG